MAFCTSIWAGSAPRFSNGAATFERVKSELLKHYYREGLSEEEIYQAAIRGLMKELDPDLSEWNSLLTPKEYGEMQSDLKGKIVGAGVEIRFEPQSGQSEVLYVVPDSPAERAGVRRGDRILSVDGRQYAGRTLAHVVEAIRGSEGDHRKLTLLRGDEVLTRRVVLTTIPFAEVTLNWPEKETALITLNYFTQNTPGHLERVLNEVKKAKALVLDLRGNMGGAFDSAVSSASLLIPQGKPIVRLMKRGEKEEILRSSRNPILSQIPSVVLINEETTCAAEFLAMALKEQLGATVVGAKSFGKWSMQKVETLGNDFAMKYTVGLFKSSEGKDLSGVGISPDVEVPLPKDQVRKLQRLSDIKARLEQDAQLRAALRVVKS